MAKGTKLSETTSPPAKAVPRHHLILVTAAVAATCGDCAKILGIAPVESESQNRWARTGRAAIQSSHSMPSRNGVARLITKPDPGARKR